MVGLSPPAPLKESLNALAFPVDGIFRGNSPPVYFVHGWFQENARHDWFPEKCPENLREGARIENKEEIYGKFKRKCKERE